MPDAASQEMEVDDAGSSSSNTAVQALRSTAKKGFKAKVRLHAALATRSRSRSLANARPRSDR